MQHIKPILVAVALLIPAFANADLIQFNAESASGLFSDFSIVFDDDGDERLAGSEVARFSGVSIAPSVPGPVNFVFYEYLVQIPSTAFSVGSQAPGLSISQRLDLLDNFNNQWVFSKSADLSNFVGIPLAFYDVSIERIEIPEPGTLALFCLGLAGIAFARRRQFSFRVCPRVTSAR